MRKKAEDNWEVFKEEDREDDQKVAQALTKLTF